MKADISGERAAVELVGVARTYGAKRAVDDLSLFVRRGVTLGLLGPNGAGKSTTLKMLMGLLAPSSGRIRVLGMDVRGDCHQLRGQVGYVPEIHNIYRWMSVGEAIRFTRSFYPTWNHTLARSLVEMFGLEPGKKVKHLSKGTTAKLSLLLAVSHEPDLLILDEPMSGLDPLVREEFLDGVLRTMGQRQQTVIFSSHTLDDIARLCDEVAIINGGRLLVHQRLDALLAGTRKIRAVLADGSLPARDPPGTIWRNLDRRQWTLTVADFTPQMLDQLKSENQLSHVEVSGVGLEDLFKDYIRGQRVEA